MSKAILLVVGFSILLVQTACNKQEVLLFQAARNKQEGDGTGVTGSEGNREAKEAPDETTGDTKLTQPEMTLAEAAQAGDLLQVEMHLRLGTDVNAIDEHGFTALHFAAGRGYPEIARDLIEAGADVNASNAVGGLTPLHLAAAAGQAKVAELLIDKGAEVNAAASKDPPGNLTTPLQEAARRGKAEVVTLLIVKGVDVDQRDTFGQTALHCAANAEVAALLIDANAQMDARDRSQFTPLKLATIDSRTDVAELLTAKGATE